MSKQSATIGKLAEALAKAQSKLLPAAKDSENPFFKSKYADLASVWEACRAALTENGLAVVQLAHSTEKGVGVETMLVHSSGEFISESLEVPAAKHDAQAFGSAITYARRYGLAAMVGVAPEDDDGNAAAKAAQPAKKKERDDSSKNVKQETPANGHGHNKNIPPKTPDELKRRINDADAAGVKAGYFAPGCLIAYVYRTTCAAPLKPMASENMDEWTPPQLAFAYAAGRTFLDEKKLEHAEARKHPEPEPVEA